MYGSNVKLFKNPIDSVLYAVDVMACKGDAVISLKTQLKRPNACFIGIAKHGIIYQVALELYLTRNTPIKCSGNSLQIVIWC